MARNSHQKLSVELVLFALTSTLLVSTAYGAPSVRCDGLFGVDSWARINSEIRPTDSPVNFEDNRSYLRQLKASASDGLMRSRFSDKFKTRFYFAATAKPGADGQIPMVNPESRATYIFFHGSGTMKSSGRNFRGLMNTLGQMGYSAMSFDMPFHMEGPTHSKFENAEYFMKWLKQIVDETRQTAGDQPIYLVGHSFGPDVIAEYLARYPHDVQGAAMLSPAGFNSTLSKWYDQKTSKMKFGGDVAGNTMAGTWAAKMSNQFIWNKTGGAHDPTLANPELKIRMLSGDREEYVPSPLGPNGLPNGRNTYDIGKAFKEHFRNAQVTIEPGIGHYLFDHRDTQGRNAVLREVLALESVDVAEIPARVRETELKFDALPLSARLSYNFAFDPIFRSWVVQTYGEAAFKRAAQRADVEFMKGVESSYAVATERRRDDIRKLIIEVAERDEDFRKAYQVALEKMKKSKDTSLFLKFAEYLESQR